MIRKFDEQRAFSRSPGVEIRVLVEPNEMFNAGRLYARITVAPGAKVTPHRHEMETESFYVAKGTVEMRDNDTVVTLTEGDMIITPDGEVHGIENKTDGPVELIALIVSREQGVDGKSVTL